MQPNMGIADRIPRIVLALVLVFFIFDGTFTGVTAFAAGAFAMGLKITGVSGYCPLYTRLGINTYTKK